MHNALQLLIIAFAIYLSVKHLIDGMLIGTPAFGYFLAEGLPISLAIPLYLLSCFVFGAVLLIKLGAKDARNTKKLTQ